MENLIKHFSQSVQLYHGCLRAAASNKIIVSASESQNAKELKSMIGLLIKCGSNEMEQHVILPTKLCSYCQKHLIAIFSYIVIDL